MWRKVEKKIRFLPFSSRDFLHYDSKQRTWNIYGFTEKWSITRGLYFHWMRVRPVDHRSEYRLSHCLIYSLMAFFHYRFETVEYFLFCFTPSCSRSILEAWSVFYVLLQCYANNLTFPYKVTEPNFLSPTTHSFNIRETKEKIQEKKHGSWCEACSSHPDPF